MSRAIWKKTSEKQQFFPQDDIFPAVAQIQPATVLRQARTIRAHVMAGIDQRPLDLPRIKMTVTGVKIYFYKY
jgi:hypothetical protein